MTNCEFCGKAFEPKRYRGGSQRQRFCDKRCKSRWWTRKRSCDFPEGGMTRADAERVLRNLEDAIAHVFPRSVTP